MNVQYCVRVSASNFQVLTRKSDGARALGNIVRFLAGPARMWYEIGQASLFRGTERPIHAKDETEAYGERNPALE